MVNLFYLDKNPYKCATYYCDKHVNKIMIEICQILNQINYYQIGNDAPYKFTKTISINLAPFKWASKSKNNYLYCLKLAEGLLNEYKFRFRKNNHKCEKIIKWLYDNIPSNFKYKNRTPFLFTNNYKIYDKTFTNKVLASRVMYIDFKCSSDKWTKREKPEWFNLLTINYDIKKKILVEKIFVNVKEELPKIYKNNKSVKVKRFHSFLRVSYDNLFKEKWNVYITKHKNMFTSKKPLIYQLGYPQLVYIYNLTNKLKKNKELLIKLNYNSLKYRKKL